MAEYKHTCKSHPRNACVACLAAMVEEGERTNWAGAVDLTDMTREERWEYLKGGWPRG